jgi:acyl dehydratase
MMGKLYFEDIEVGQEFAGDTILVAREQMLAIAKDFDSQKMHVDSDAAKAMGFDDVIASGAYTFAAAIKTVQCILDRFHFLPSGLGIEISFVRPVLAGDEITAHAEVVSKRRSEKGGRGWAIFKANYVNQDGNTVAEVSWPWLFRTRPAE